MDCEQHDTTENALPPSSQSPQHHGIIQPDDDDHQVLLHTADGFLDSDDDDHDEEMPDDHHRLDSDEEDDDHDDEMADDGHAFPEPPSMHELFGPYLLPVALLPTGADGHQPPPSSTLEFAPYLVLPALLPTGTFTYVLVPLQGSTTPLGDGGWYSNGGFGAVPAPDAAVAGLKKREFRGWSQDGDAAAAAAGCRICFEEFEDGEEVSVMPCSGGHEFHTQCIAKWLGISNACPLCRHQLPSA